ncbi:MAG TPA: DNA gyrase/topoisomerase IV subunit A, partial [Mucilaginibacter sp.]
SVVHVDGKSKNYMVKRFVFENTTLGRQTSIISEEGGSKMVLISGAVQPVVKVEQLKGKVETPETLEVNLSELIDIKGMKAMGNRLSQHTVKSITLIAEINPVIEDSEPASEEDIETEESNESNIEPAEESIEPKGESGESKNQSVESSENPVQSPPKKIDFEITNPDDIDIDDKGQLGLF